MNLIQQNYPYILTQPPTLTQHCCLLYLLSETVQITRNGAHHWQLLPSLKGNTVIHDNLKTDRTESLLAQVKQLFSHENILP